MTQSESGNLSIHAAALCGVVALHAGIAAWAMQPSAPVVIPQQQVLQVAMVAPSQLVPVVKAVPEKVTPPPVPKKETGMRKETPKKVVKQEPAPQPAPKEIAEARPAAQQRITSGRQSEQAVAQVAAITEPVFNAAYLNNPAPAYPRNARKRRIEGTVMLNVDVTAQGTPRAVAVARSSGHDMLDAAARDAVQRWRFVPARRGSDVVEARVLVPVEFRIN